MSDATTTPPEGLMPNNADIGANRLLAEIARQDDIAAHFSRAVEHLGGEEAIDALHDAGTLVDELHKALLATDAQAPQYEYAYGDVRQDSKPGPRVHRTYQSLKQFIASGYNFPGYSWRRQVGPWERIDPETGEPL